MNNLEDNQTFYYKIVAKLNSKYYSIYEGKTEYELGQTLYQKAEPNHQVNPKNYCIIILLYRVDSMCIVPQKKLYMPICTKIYKISFNFL